MIQGKSILIDGQHWDWKEIDPAEFASWQVLEEMARRLRKVIADVETTQQHCIDRTLRRFQGKI